MYKGIIIPQKVIIVENSEGQGFVVPQGNEKVLATAMNWASTIIYPKEGTWEEKKKGAYKFTGIQHEYENGHFKMQLSESAGYSYNGGKLSFWNCNITAPDGKVFLVGINQELLCNLLMNCTLIKGEVQEELWLGKQQGNTGLYTSSMDDFKQATEELQQKEDFKKKTKNYKVGDLVGTITKKFVYLGEHTRYNYVDYRAYDFIDWSKRVLTCIPVEKNSTYHLYLECLESHDGSYYYHLVPRETKSSYSIIQSDYMEVSELEKVKELFQESDYPPLRMLEYFKYDSIQSVLEDLKTYDKNHTYYLTDSKGT